MSGSASEGADDDLETADIDSGDAHEYDGWEPEDFATLAERLAALDVGEALPEQKKDNRKELATRQDRQIRTLFADDVFWKPDVLKAKRMNRLAVLVRQIREGASQPTMNSLEDLQEDRVQDFLRIAATFQSIAELESLIREVREKFAARSESAAPTETLVEAAPEAPVEVRVERPSVEDLSVLLDHLNHLRQAAIDESYVGAREEFEEMKALYSLWAKGGVSTDPFQEELKQAFPGWTKEDFAEVVRELSDLPPVPRPVVPVRRVFPVVKPAVETPKPTPTTVEVTYSPEPVDSRPGLERFNVPSNPRTPPRFRNIEARANPDAEVISMPSVPDDVPEQPMRREASRHPEERVSGWAKRIRGWFGGGAIGDYAVEKVTGQRTRNEREGKRPTEDEAKIRVAGGVISALATIFPVKLFANVGMYLSQEHFVREERAELFASLKSVLEANTRIAKKSGSAPEQILQANLDAGKRVERAIATSPYLTTKEKAQMTQEILDLAQIYQKGADGNTADRDRAITRVVMNKVKAIITDHDVTKEGVNSTLWLLGYAGDLPMAETLRGVSYAAISFLQRFERAAKADPSASFIENTADVFRNAWETTWGPISEQLRNRGVVAPNLGDAVNTLGTAVGMAYIAIGGQVDALPGIRAAINDGSGPSLRYAAIEAQRQIQNAIDTVLPAFERAARREA